ANGAEPRTARVELGGAGAVYSAEAFGEPEHRGRVARASGWHRLLLEFDADRFRASVDERVVWSGPGAGGPLRAVRFLCRADGGGAARGELVLDEFALARRPGAEPPRRVRDPGQDEVTRPDGDQWFGRLTGADRSALTLGRRSIPWGEVRAIHFARAERPAAATEGEHVRLRLRTGDG